MSCLQVSLPKLEVLLVSQLENLERLGHGPLLVGSLSKLKGFLVRDCGKLLCVFPSQLVPMLGNLEELTVERCKLLEAVFELEGVDSNEPNPELLSSLKVVKLRDLPKLNYISKRDPMRFEYIQTLDIYNCNSLECVFAPTVTKSIPHLHELKIQRCETLSTIVAEENGVDEFEFPQLERLELIGLPNLRRFCKSTNLKFPLLTKINISFCPIMDAFSLGQVSAPNLSSSGILWNGNLLNAIQLLQENGDDLMATSMEKPRILDYVACKSKSWQVAKTQCRLVAMPERINGPHKVARLLYTNSGNGVLALGCNGSMRLWKCGSSKHNPIGKATANVVPQQWQPASGLAMTNDLTGAKLEEVVPCIALSKDDSYVISAHGGVISLFNMMTFKVMTTFMPPPPASTFLAFYPQDNNVIAIGMKDYTIRIYNVSVDEVKFILEGHKKRITGLAFSTKLNILVSSGADAQICIWSTNTWKKLKSVPIQMPSGKARNGDTRVQFHSNQLHLLVSQETQLAIYDASKMDRICQWVPQDVLPAPISCATYSCDSQLVYVSFCDGNIGVFDADNLTVLCRIAQSKYLSPALLTGREDVCPLVIAAHPQLPNQFAIGLTDGFVMVMEMEPPTITGLNGGTASSANANNQTLDQGEGVDVDKDLNDDVDEDALITTRTRTTTATMSTHDDEEDLEEKQKRVEEEKRKKKGKAPISG
ncbi:hypothetical protein Vadar_011126 [Vaccinium darrowii]|uniref:Uncharacterized protein n=1 Tax=Vaccinium darrowii TaxID=229202 RepID=A0ACB7YLA2_9ERIC|nr:hypothetical protein Vadar_011126 [Vaccinium darrowii]